MVVDRREGNSRGRMTARERKWEGRGGGDGDGGGGNGGGGGGGGVGGRKKQRSCGAVRCGVPWKAGLDNLPTTGHRISSESQLQPHRNCNSPYPSLKEPLGLYEAAAAAASSADTS